MFYTGSPLIISGRTLTNYVKRDNSTYTAESVPLVIVGLEWTDAGYKLYLDGVETNESGLTRGTLHGEAFRNENVPQGIIISIASELSANENYWGGSISDASYPSSFYVDYVRYYELVAD